ncbi:MAG: RDD family protein [Betaproteobacteria bacterium]|nr:RDD family protein [Betaproteobacteria bacterium]
MAGPEPTEVPGIWRRLAALPYESLLILAVLFVAAFPLAGFKGWTLQGVPHFLSQVYLLSVTAFYFTWFWQRGGQTLAMKTWRFRVTGRSGQPLTLTRALARFGCALLFYGPSVAGLLLLFFPKRISPVIAMWTCLPMFATILWARFDPDRQFLHDRMAGTRLVSVVAD